MEAPDSFSRLYHRLMESYRMPPDMASRQLDAILKRVGAASRPNAPSHAAYPEAGGIRYGQ